MLVNQVLADRVFIICGKTDMRKAINGLAEIVQNQYNLNPYESGWKMVSINGLRQPMRFGVSQNSSSDGFWKGWPSTSQKRLGKFIQHESIKFVILGKSAKKPYIYWLYGTFCGIISV